MIFFPNCKINIGLYVTGTREDGFHSLESVFYPLAMNDVLEMRVSEEKTRLTVSGSFFDTKDVVTDERNSVLKAYRMLKEDFPTVPELNIHLDKGIPCFAGLGGGSSDATYALRLIDYMFSLHLSEKQLYDYALRLGSDNAFFIHNEPMFVYGRGEKMERTSLSLKDYYIALVKPEINISTKEAYSNVHITEKPFDLRKLGRTDIREWKDLIGNDFETELFKTHPLLKEIKDCMYSMGALYSQMSGSGSTIYGIFDKEPDTDKLKQLSGAFVYKEKIKK